MPGTCVIAGEEMGERRNMPCLSVVMHRKWQDRLTLCLTPSDRELRGSRRSTTSGWRGVLLAMGLLSLDASRTCPSSAKRVTGCQYEVRQYSKNLI